jgi:adenylate cyclase
VNTGVAYVGAVGTADHVEFTALGDVVNVTARLASAAGAGELLVGTRAAEAAALSTDGLERRQLDLRGKSAATDVFVLTSANSQHQQL